MHREESVAGLVFLAQPKVNESQPLGIHNEESQITSPPWHHRSLQIGSATWCKVKSGHLSGNFLIVSQYLLCLINLWSRLTELSHNSLCTGFCTSVGMSQDFSAVGEHLKMLPCLDPPSMMRINSTCKWTGIESEKAISKSLVQGSLKQLAWMNRFSARNSQLEGDVLSPKLVHCFKALIY